MARNVFPFLCSLMGCLLAFPHTSAHAQVAQTTDAFGLKAGDRVVFYGDSITEQQYFTRDVEMFALTRFPGRHVTFYNAGIGGDKVSGGGGGPIDQRLPRDLFSLHPTVITVMLGMNDGYYKRFDPGVLQTFDVGYRYIADQIAKNAGSALVTLIGSSPYDEFTHPGGITGYNDALIHLGDVVKQIGAQHGYSFVDFNAPTSAALKRAAALNPALATLMVADRVHPGPGIHWVMAEALLKQWNASADISAVTLDAGSSKAIEERNATTSGIHKVKDELSWDCKEAALPLPLYVGELAVADPVDALALSAAPIVNDLDREMLQVHGLAAGTYSLSIDHIPVHSFTNEELNAGINLATFSTPMLAQAQHVALLNEGKLGLDITRNRVLRGTQDPATVAVLASVNAALEKADAAQWAAARPTTHHFSLAKQP